MDTFLELIQALQSDMNIGDESSLYSLANVKLALNRSYRKAGALYRWPETEDAKRTSTQLGINYYDYPTNWRPDSIYRLEIDGDQYGEDPDGSPMDYRDFLIWLADDDNANSTEKKWSTQWRRYFVYPTPTAAGTNNIYVWGQKTVDKLTENTDITIFSYAYPECNDAIVREAKAILKNKVIDKVVDDFMDMGAKNILTNAWNKIKQEKAKFEKTQPFFYVGDLFGGSKSNYKIGNFYPEG